MSEHEELLAVATGAALAAGALLADRFAVGGEAAVQAKSSPTDQVTQADLDAEALIRRRISQARPGDGILGEEGGDVAGTTGLRWVVDPLDGTIDFLYGIPQWAVSVAVEDAGGATLAGVVHDPVRGETFTATAAGPARLNDRPVPTARRAGGMADALVATGFGYEAAVRAAQAQVAARVLPQVRDLRRFGSAALDLCWAAVGRVDAYWEFGVRRWDIAAGGLVCERAGLSVRTLAAAGALPPGVLAAPPALADELAPLLVP